jgi:hypothetical protein
MTNPEIQEIYAKLEANKDEEQESNPFTDKHIIKMANYLGFFEPFYPLIQKGFLDIETLDRVFAYRFFLATDNRHMQAMLLVKKPKAFRNIYLLHRLWRTYRPEQDDLWQKDFCLSRTPEYESTLKP